MPVQNRTEIVIVRHEREAAKSSGTARLAELMLGRLKILEYQGSRSDVSPAFTGSARTWLLYPGGAAQPAPPPATAPQRLIVLDGTWMQSRRMLKRITELHTLPWLSLPAKETATLRLRMSPSLDARSTLEAIADALLLLEGEAVAKPLHAAHELFVERVLRARGVWGYRVAAGLCEEGPAK